jgi:hypothetical protein
LKLDIPLQALEQRDPSERAMEKNGKNYLQARVKHTFIAREGEILHNHTVPIIGYREDTNRRTYLQQMGSGVLVFFGNIYGILTARHVSEQIMNYEGIALPLAENSVQRFFIKRSHLDLLELERPTNEEIAPDLAFIKLGINDASTIRVHKVFSNMELHSRIVKQHRPSTQEGIWFVCGSVLEQATKQIGGSVFEFIHTYKTYSFEVRFGNLIQPNGFDYVDVTYNYPFYKNPPESFGGISGGGLWQVILGYSKDGEIIGQRFLAGIVFYQSAKLDETRKLRANFIDSVYEKFYPMIIERFGE